MSPSLRLVSAGAAMVGVTFGLARYGYGLLLPDLRLALDLDSATLGLIGSGSFAAYLAAVMFMLAAGLLLGPAGGGVLADSAGLPAAFVVGGVVIAATALLSPREERAPSRA